MNGNAPVRACFGFVLLMLLSSLSGCIFEQTDAGGDEEVLAVFNYSPSSNIRSGDPITFDDVNLPENLINDLRKLQDNS